MGPGFFARVAPSAAEVDAAMAGDDLVPDADVVMDRAFTVPAPPPEVWPWLVQLGKGRAGWYLPRRAERLLPRSRRASRSLVPRFQGLRVGEVIPDYGGRQATFEVAALESPHTLVYRSRRGRMQVSWAIRLAPAPPAAAAYGGAATRVQLRLRLGPVRRRRLATYGGGLVDLVTIAGLAAGLTERVLER